MFYKQDITCMRHGSLRQIIVQIKYYKGIDSIIILKFLHCVTSLSRCYLFLDNMKMNLWVININNFIADINLFVGTFNFPFKMSKYILLSMMSLYYNTFFFKKIIKFIRIIPFNSISRTYVLLNIRHEILVTFLFKNVFNNNSVEIIQFVNVI